jgi:ring-1,2-phenylacetyl-CoA epoxidase subunit PaaE
MPTTAAFIRGWFSQPSPTFELRRPSARWSASRSPLAARRWRVLDVIDETPTTRTFVLETTSAAEPVVYRAGQHLTLVVEVDGAAHRRCYSFSSSPVAGARPAITVRRKPDGIVSRHLHDHVRAGDTLIASGPAGQFTMTTTPSASRTVALIAGGVGITPLVSLTETLLREEPRSRAVLLCGNRSEDEIIFRTRLAALEAEFAPRLAVRHALDNPAPDWQGLSGPLDGPRVLDALGDLRPDAYYVCGPQPMMESICSTLAGAGVGSEQIHTERFSYAAATAARIPDRAAEIRFAATGRRVTAMAGQTLLQAGLRAGVDLPYSCTMGGCGACKVKKLSGTVVTSEPNCLSEHERAQGYVLTCCSYADSSVTIDGF